eukprot:11038844-Lingulodinium_polyedra.AAC.1
MLAFGTRALGARVLSTRGRAFGTFVSRTRVLRTWTEGRFGARAPAVSQQCQTGRGKQARSTRCARSENAAQG